MVLRALALVMFLGPVVLAAPRTADASPAGLRPADVAVSNLDVACSVSALISAISAANANAGPDTIDLAAGCTYTLTAANNSAADGANGLPLITGDLVIEGNGATIARSAAGGTPAFRLLRATSGNLTIRNLTLSNGRIEASDAYGGAIRVANDLTIESSTVSGNTLAAGDEAQGAGTHSAGKTTITNSIYSGNEATSEAGTVLGGGAFAGGSFSVTGSTFSDNAATSTSFVLGGGASSTGAMTVTNSTFARNRAEGRSGSGAGTNSQSSVTITGSVFVDNEATAIGPTSAAALGGGTRATAALSITASTYSGNTATSVQTAQGGGAYALAAITVQTSTFNDNLATSTGAPASGGALYGNASVIMTNSTVSGNSASGPGVVSQGGGVYAPGGIMVSNSTITGNTIAGDNPRGGGLMSESSLTVTNSIVALNVPTDCVTFGSVLTGPSSLDGDGTCGSAATSAAPGLLPLALNAPGTTKTHALATNSPARNIGVSCQPLDQTGISRPRGAGCDAGAWEGAELAFDVDCDRDEDAVDALAVLRQLAGLATSPPPCDADVDNSAAVDIRDVLAVRLYLALVVD